MRTLNQVGLMLADLTQPLALSREQLAARNPKLARQLASMAPRRAATAARRIVTVTQRAPEAMTKVDAKELMGAMQKRIKRAARNQKNAAAGGFMHVESAE